MIWTLAWYVVPVLAFIAASFLSLRSYARFARRARGAPQHALPRGPDASPLDLLCDPVQARHPGQQGLFNLLDGREAFAVRALSAQNAGRSLDIITYIWTADTTGWLMIDELVAAADRGVRVRLLLDDVNVQGFDPVFLGLAMHPRIEVRLFNPIRNRGHVIRRTIEFALGLSRFNRRIHSKAWIVDGRLAVIGGRNVGDIYFDARAPGEPTAIDADMVLVGSRLSQVEGIFDTYWNLALSLPILTLWPGLRTNMRGFRRRLARHVRDPVAQQYRSETLSPHDAQGLLVDRLRWTDRVEVVSDPPEKAFGRRTGPWLSDRIETMLRQASQEVRLVTPYFVPGQQGMDLLGHLRRRGIAVSLLTNSLATIDHAPIHGAYTYYRKPLLALGVALHEYAPQPGHRRRRALVHSKIFLVDQRQALIGSSNFDLRSANINIELGLYFEQDELLAELVQSFQAHSARDMAFAVTLQQGRLVWVRDQSGQPVTLHAEPAASLLRLALAGVMRMLPHAFF